MTQFLNGERVWTTQFEPEGEWMIRCECGNHNDPGTMKCDLCGDALTGGNEHPCYVPKKFNDEHTQIILKANEILADYVSQGFRLSLRQLYYQFVAKDLIENTDRSYKRFGKIITDARLAGLMSFEHIEDRGRTAHAPWSQPDPAAVLNDIEYAYSEDMWDDQDHYVEVWVEKDALSDVIARPCNKFDVTYMACKGYMSASAQWEAGNRFKKAIEDGKWPVLIHLGDHDPSGIDMTRDNGTRLDLFTDDNIEVRRIALNMDQVDQYNPPPNPAKVTDSRASDYIAQYGSVSWELDALQPSVIADLIKAEINPLIDADRWNAKLERQRENRELLAKIGHNADAVFDFVKGLD